MSLQDVDVNLVPMLQVLLRERSVSRTAQLLGLSQPAISAALRRMRAALGDDLLVRIGGHMELTQRAVDLIEPVDAACASLEQLFVRPQFVPAEAERTFVIAIPDQATFLLGPAWIDAIRRTAPQVRLRFVALGDTAHDQLAAREVDFAVLPSFFIDDVAPVKLVFRPLYRDQSVVLFRAGHPLAARKRIGEAMLADYRWLSFHPVADWIERKRSSVLLSNRTFDTIAYVPGITLLPFLLLKGDDFAIFSRRVAEQLVELMPLAWRPLAFATPPLDIGIAWSHLKDADPAHRWFRETVVGAGR